MQIIILKTNFEYTYWACSCILHVFISGCKLMLVAILGIVVFYIYSLILFAFYRGRMWSADNGRHCRNIYECFVSVLNHGFVGGPYTVRSALSKCPGYIKLCIIFKSTYSINADFDIKERHVELIELFSK